MFKRVKTAKLDRLSQSASDLGFKETYLKLEGLAEHMSGFSKTSEEKKPAKARWLLAKIETSRPAINKEMLDKKARSFFYEQKEGNFRYGVLVGTVVNLAACAVWLGLLMNGSEYAMKYGFAAVGAALAVTIAYMVNNTIKNKFTTFSGFVKSVFDALAEAEKNVRGYLEK